MKIINLTNNRHSKRFVNWNAVNHGILPTVGGQGRWRGEAKISELVPHIYKVNHLGVGDRQYKQTTL